MSRFTRVAAALGIAAALVLAPASAATADVDDFEIESFHADYLLTRGADGHARLSVTETIVAVYPDFDQNKGFYRDIPEYRHGVQLHTEVTSVVDEDGDPVPYSTEYYYDFFSVALGDDSFVRGRHTYVITYRQVDVVEAFADTKADEFYWDVNGTGWAQPFGSASMTLTVDAGIAPALTGNAACYTFTACEDDIVATPQPDGSVVFTAAARDLRPNESLTVAVGFAPDTFEPGVVVVPPSSDPSYQPPEPPAPPLTWWDKFAPFVLAPAGFLLSLIAKSTQATDRSRRTAASDIIVPQYTPPKGLDVMTAAYLAGRPERAYAAQLVDLAVRGKVRMLDDRSRSSAGFEVELVDAADLSDLETQFVEAVFGGRKEPGTRVSVGAKSPSLGRRLASVFRAVDARMKNGYRGAPRPTVLWTVLCILAIAVAVVAGFDAARRLGDGVLPEMALAGAGVAIVCAFLVVNRRATVAPLNGRGRELNDHLLGMRDYMQLAEADRIRMLQSPEGAERVDVDDATQMVKLYERLLPYAVIFGIEEEWAEQLTLRAVEAEVPVTWWAGSGELSSWRLTSTLHTLRQATPQPPQPVAARAKTSSSDSGWGGWGSGTSSSGWSGWSGSSGSSFSGGSFGGGFSGGGGGGGGGRGR